MTTRLSKKVKIFDDKHIEEGRIHRFHQVIQEEGNRKKKKMKNVVYYETDPSVPSTSDNTINIFKAHRVRDSREERLYVLRYVNRKNSFRSRR